MSDLISDSNTRATCVFCKKEMVARHLYNHFTRLHFSELWSEANRKKAEKALTSSATLGICLDIGGVDTFLNPVKGRLYTKDGQCDRQLKKVSLDDYRKSIQRILDHKPVARPTVQPLNESEAPIIQKILDKMRLLLKFEHEDVYEKQAECRALRRALLRFLPEAEIDKIEPEFEEEIEHIDLAQEFKKELSQVKSVRVVPEATQSGVSKPKSSEKRPSKPTPPLISAPPVSEVSSSLPPPQSVPEPVSVPPIVSVAPRVANEPLPAPAPVSPAYAPGWAQPAVPEYLQRPILGMKRPVKKAQSADERGLTLLTT